MNLMNLLRLALRAMGRNKTRALLTMLGIVIGISAVITMLSLGESVKNGMKAQFAEMGTNSIMILPARQQRGGVDMGASASRSLDMKDYAALEASCPHVAAFSPQIAAPRQMVVGANNHLGSITGVSPDYLMINNYKLERGLMFGTQEVKESAKVCVIGQTVAKDLFGEGNNPVGQTIRFGSIPMKVIGVLAAKGQGNFGDDADDIALAPYTTVQKRFLGRGNEYLYMLQASASSQEASVMAADEIKRTLRRTHGIAEGDDDDFEVMTMDEILSSMDRVMGMVTLLLTFIAGISLVVGGIGIMNIMYVTVTERTREIGLRKAVGARESDIMKQFLIESVVLSLTGGLIGILLGVVFSYGATALITATNGDLQLQYTLSLKAVAISFVVCVVVGVFFGWYPSRRASRLDPIVALRYE